MNTHGTTITATAREMAQQLKTLVNSNDYKGELPTDEERFIYKHGLAIADTLDALAQENAKLREDMRTAERECNDQRILDGITVEKALCKALGREWQQNDYGIQSLIDALVNRITSFEAAFATVKAENDKLRARHAPAQ